jgi:glycosyltransferase involved in cell wall biosynthesis
MLSIKMSDEELAVEYAGAAAFIYPSAYEGFGLPVLEAFASGTVVACSRTSSLPEAGGTAAFYFDPLDVESIVQSLTKIVQLTPSERTERIRHGQLHARSLSWMRCIRKTCEILDSVACAKTAT